jgi:hypothetical protein
MPRLFAGPEVWVPEESEKRALNADLFLERQVGSDRERNAPLACSIVEPA